MRKEIGILLAWVVFYPVVWESRWRNKMNKQRKKMQCYVCIP